MAPMGSALDKQILDVTLDAALSPDFKVVVSL